MAASPTLLGCGSRDVDTDVRFEHLAVTTQLQGMARERMASQWVKEALGNNHRIFTLLKHTEAPQVRWMGGDKPSVSYGASCDRLLW